IMASRIVLLAPAMALSTLFYFILGMIQERPFAEVQTGTFTVLVVCQWFNALNCRSDRTSVFQMSLLRNPWLLLGLGIANLLQAVVIFVPFLNRIFYTVPIAWSEMILIGILASMVLW